jgi:hypothetical protein
MDEMLLIVIVLTTYFVGFASGFGTRAIISRYRNHKELRAREARLGFAAAEGELRRHGKEISKKLPGVVTALVIVSGVIVVDHFKGPLFPDELYCLNDDGAQITRVCTGRVPPNGKPTTPGKT